LQFERCVVTREGAFTRSHEEEEGDACHVGNACKILRDWLSGQGVGWCSMDHLNGHRLDSLWRRILFSVAAHLPVQSEVDAAVGVKADVWGPHAPVRLANAT